MCWCVGDDGQPTVRLIHGALHSGERRKEFVAGGSRCLVVELYVIQGGQHCAAAGQGVRFFHHLGLTQPFAKIVEAWGVGGEKGAVGVIDAQ